VTRNDSVAPQEEGPAGSDVVTGCGGSVNPGIGDGVVVTGAGTVDVPVFINTPAESLNRLMWSTSTHLLWVQPTSNAAPSVGLTATSPR